jgi:hypothetical protein
MVALGAELRVAWRTSGTTRRLEHDGDLCTVEVLPDRFGIRDAAVKRITEFVHDIDLKEDRYKSLHTVTIAHLVEGFGGEVLVMTGHPA